jgi:SAM-dependent methyltransferase
LDLREVSSDSEIRHPWETVRYSFIRSELGSFLLNRTGLRILDVGSGDAWLASRIAQDFTAVSEIVCWDSAYESASDQGKVRLVARRPGERFDVLLLLDVLEHVDGDRKFLTELVSENLAPGGIVIITVPAWQALYGSHDKFLKHYRRYSPNNAEDLVTESGLRVWRRGMLFHSLLLLRVLIVIWEKLRQMPSEFNGVGKWDHGILISRLVEVPLRAEISFSRCLANWNLFLPGLSWWAVCGPAGISKNEISRP